MPNASPRPGLLLGLIRARARCSRMVPVLVVPCSPALPISGGDGGAVLSQVQDEEEWVIAYVSKSLEGSEQRYCTARKELLAVVRALKHFKCYLYGQKITVRTDNSAGNSSLVRCGDARSTNPFTSSPTSRSLPALAPGSARTHSARATTSSLSI